LIVTGDSAKAGTLSVEMRGVSKMGVIINERAADDPYPRVSVIGFANSLDAIAYVANGFKTTCNVNPNLQLTVLDIGKSVEYNQYSYVIFYYAPSTLMGIIECASDIQGLKIGSWGVQMTLERYYPK
jgi:hypothetical protein